MNVPVKYLKLLGIVGLIVIILGGIFVSTGINPKYLIAGDNAKKTAAVSEISPEPSDMPSDSPSDGSSSSADDNIDNATQTIQPTVTGDPVVSCTVQHVGTVQMTQSQCNASFACQIGDSWTLYTDKNKCTADQKLYYQMLYGYSSTSSDNSTSAPAAVYPTVDTSGQQSVQDCISEAQQMYQNTIAAEQQTARSSGIDPSKVSIGTDATASNQEAQAIYNCQH